MAKPRVFVSSTFYDLKQVRADLERFIKDLGYESILNERGNIAYGSTEKLEEYCYKEVGLCDIVIAIIGGRIGSSSSDDSYHSITQKEIGTALKNNKQVYVFVEKNVLAEYETYLINKNNDTITYKYVDDIKIYQFIESVQSLPNNNTMHGFETSNDIILFLREQWAGLFQRFLQEQIRVKEVNKIIELEKTAETLNQLVNFLTDEKKEGNQTIINILMNNHPAMEQLRKDLKVPYRVYFTKYSELNSWLKARGFLQYEDILGEYSTDMYIWEWARNEEQKILQVSKSIFDKDDKLNVFTKDEWKESYIKLEEIDNLSNLVAVDEMPF